jgi:predicted CXXCH cytochrome family protein
VRILVRFLSHKTKGSDTRQDVPLTGPRLRIGRGTDQDIHLPNLRIALAHAELDEGQDGKIRLHTSLASGFQHNGTTVQAAILVPGDQVDMGGFKLRIGQASGCDLAIEISEDPAARGRDTEIALLQRAKLTLAAAGLTKRRWALGAAGAILTAFLVIPLLAALVPSAGHWLRLLPLVPSDHAWSSGKVSDAHAHFGTDCHACHTIPFVPTRNSACLECHQDTAHHVEADVLKTGLFENARCGSCHYEHAGRQAISRRDEGLCANCHEDLKSVLATTKIADVANFGSEHPEFRPLLRDTIDGKPMAKRVVLTDKTALRETSGIEFSHQGHLTPTGIEGPNGTVKLACGDCHQVEPGGGAMQPITFERNCHACHQLNIPGDVVREAPHGDITAAQGAIADYYQAWALRGGYPNGYAPASVQARRLPGQPLTPIEQQEALDWAKRSADQAASEMFGYTTCGVCHTAEPAKDGSATWRVKPVNIPHRWLPQARFSHAQHATQACADCHRDAAQSTTSADVLLPGIETCRGCHASGDAGEGKLASTCVTCHQFHRAQIARLNQ